MAILQSWCIRRLCLYRKLPFCKTNKRINLATLEATNSSNFCTVTIYKLAKYMMETYILRALVSTTLQLLPACRWSPYTTCYVWLIQATVATYPQHLFARGTCTFMTRLWARMLATLRSRFWTSIFALFAIYSRLKNKLCCNSYNQLQR